MVSTITPALVELLANTLNSLEWEFSDSGQLVDKENSDSEEYLFFEETWDKVDRAGTMFIPPGRLANDLDLVTCRVKIISIRLLDSQNKRHFVICGRRQLFEEFRKFKKYWKN